MEILSCSTLDGIRKMFLVLQVNSEKFPIEQKTLESKFQGASNPIHVFYGINFFSHPDFTVGTGILCYIESHQFSRTRNIQSAQTILLPFLSGSRTIPPVGNYTLPRRIHSFYGYYYNS